MRLRSDREAQMVERHLGAFPILRVEGVDDIRLAAELRRTARHIGSYHPQDARPLIAVACVRTNAPILRADGDFDLLATGTRRGCENASSASDPCPVRDRPADAGPAAGDFV
jgi:predicted nucleic acid-binding protein